MSRTAVLGLPRIGRDRELKVALEGYWAGTIGSDELLTTAQQLRVSAWRAAGEHIDVLPVGDFSVYDHVLDMSVALGVVPDRFGGAGATSLEAYFAMARGSAHAHPLELTKWFDTNYHYLVPELHPDQRFRANADHWVAQLGELRTLGLTGRPVLLGPISFLLLAKGHDRPLRLVDALCEAYAELLAALAQAGAVEVQLDEPMLTIADHTDAADAFAAVFPTLAAAGPALCLCTYFAGFQRRSLRRLLAVEPAEVHVDLIRAPEQLEPTLRALAGGTRLSLGVVDGRNVWRCDLDQALDLIHTATAAIGAERVTIASSCSLLHVPWSAARETSLNPAIRPWLAFADEKLSELATLKAAAHATPSHREQLLQASRNRLAGRKTSAHTHDPAVRRRVSALTATDYERSAGAEERAQAQRARVSLPELPTTTIGSFPQTDEIRRARADHRAGLLNDADYDQFLRDQIAETVARQEQLGLDVLVHGEPERNDMVQYFAEHLSGFAITEHGWVQSYGSRCVKPPILYGDVSRPAPITVRWWQHAQSLTTRPMKGMLTGPVTILQWSFVRDDQPRSDTCTQIALAIQDEVTDLQHAGAFAIQIDEAALREGLPLDPTGHDHYLRWAVDCFRLTTATAGPTTQIHTHMCYSEFTDIVHHIARLDADVLSIEASRSDMDLLDAFQRGAYPNQIGPGVYDIHSPRIPTIGEIEKLLATAETHIPRDKLWVNPDCGLKTRQWDEALPALAHMIEAAHRRRAAVSAD